MASDAEIERIRKDTQGWRSLAARILAQTKPGDLSDENIDFLEQIQVRPWLEELSYRQAEYILGLRDSVMLVSIYKGRSISSMIRFCRENLLAIAEGENEEEEKDWITNLARQSPQSLRRHEASRLHSLAKQLGATH